MDFDSLIPELSMTDLEKSIRFYWDLLGFEVEYKRDEIEIVSKTV